MPCRVRNLGICSVTLSMLLVLGCILSSSSYNNANAQVHSKTLESVTGQPGELGGYPQISTGEFPMHIYGDPTLGLIYVANYGSNTVSVIDTTTNTLKQTITVGDSPNDIFGDEGIFLDIDFDIYVANENSNTVSVINTTTNTVQAEIPVGKHPLYSYRDPNTNDLYVANSGSGGITIVDGDTYEAVAGVTLDTNPFRGGDIICNTDGNDLEAPINHFLYISVGTKCIAKPNKGFEFSSWDEVLGGNSTRTINASFGSPWTAFLDTINLKPDDPSAILTINRFGNFTAYFRALPPAVPSEYLIPLYGIVASTVVGLSIPSIITWRKSKKQIARLNSFHQEMTSLDDDGRLDEKDFEHLNMINTNVIISYSEGRINNEQYTNLKKEISVLYQKIYKKRIDKLRQKSDDDLDHTIHLDNINDDIENAYSEGKITELHFNLLNDKVAKMTSKNDNEDNI